MMQRTIPLIVALMLAGCKVGPDYERPEVVTPEVYRGAELDGESIADMPWWELFGDTVLQNLIETSLENNLDLQIAIARIAEARANLGFVKADLYPRIDLIASGALESTTEDGTPSGSGVAAGAVTWEVDLFGRIRRSNEAALQQLLATEEAYRAITITLVADVASSYLLLRDIDNRLFVSESTVQTRQQTLEIMRVRFEAGMISEVDFNQAEIQLFEAEAAVQAFTRLRAQTENVIAFLIGDPPRAIERGLRLDQQVMPPEVPTGLPSALLERRPDILVAERELAAQTARIGVAEAAKFPSLTLTADLGAQIASVTTGFLSLGADLFAPLFNAGKLESGVQAEVARTEQLLKRYEGSILIALKEVSDALVAVRTLETEYAARARQVRAARNATDLSWERYQGGLTSYLEYLELQRSLFNAQLKASETLQLQLSSVVELYRALGGGWSPLPESQANGGSEAEASPE